MTSSDFYAGLTGRTNWEQAQVEQVADTMDDLRAEVAKWIYEQTEEKKVGDFLYPSPTSSPFFKAARHRSMFSKRSVYHAA